MKIAVLLHLFYHNFWPFFSTSLKRIQRPFDLYVNLTSEKNLNKLEALTQEIKFSFPGATVLVSPNIHRDIGGLIVLMNHIFDSDKEYDLAVFLHSKYHTDNWRKQLVNSIMGDPECVESIILTFEKNATVGMIGCREWLLDGRDRNSMRYLLRQKYFLELFGLKYVLGKFIAGTMFWVRWQIFSNTFGKQRIRIENLQKEDPWVVERLFGNLVTSQNFIILGR